MTNEKLYEILNQYRDVIIKHTGRDLQVWRPNKLTELANELLDAKIIFDIIDDDKIYLEHLLIKLDGDEK